jgi:hypothetical protein
MALPLPNLDDRSFTDLVEEARALIPVYARGWTNHNPSDPGMMLIELFAWLTEMLMYRANQVSAADTEVFLRLLNGPEWVPAGSLEDAVRETNLALRARYRAVTVEDYEFLATQVWPTTPEAQALAAQGVVTTVRRARCLPGRNLEPGGAAVAAGRAAQTPGHITLIVVSGAENGQPLSAGDILPDERLLDGLWAWLADRRLLTVRHHVVGPAFARVTVTARLFLRQDAVRATVRARCVKDCQEFFHPLSGGPARGGWPFGRDVHVSEVYELLEKVPGVDYVERVTLGGPGVEATGGEAVKLAPYELVELVAGPDSFELCKSTVKDGADAGNNTVVDDCE